MTVPTFGLKRGLVAAAAVGALLLAGCSDDGDDASKGDTSSETTAAADGASETTEAADETAEGSDAASETTAKGSDSTKKPAADRDPSVEGFCGALTDIADQPAGEQDFGPLQAAAPDEIAPMVDTLAETAQEATATEQPSAELQERGIRSVVGVTIYALDECDDADGLIKSIGLDKAEVELLGKYSVKDVEDDAKWNELMTELQQG